MTPEMAERRALAVRMNDHEAVDLIDRITTLQQEKAALEGRVAALQGPDVGTCVLCGLAVRQMCGYFEDKERGLRHVHCQEHARAEQAERERDAAVKH